MSEGEYQSCPKCGGYVDYPADPSYPSVVPCSCKPEVKSDQGQQFKSELENLILYCRLAIEAIERGDVQCCYGPEFSQPDDYPSFCVGPYAVFDRDKVMLAKTQSAPQAQYFQVFKRDAETAIPETEPQITNPSSGVAPHS